LVSAHHALDLYHSILQMSWLKFIALFVLIFLLVNAVFGYLFFIGEGSIGGMKENSFLACFFFSVQTLATIGYGSLYPQTIFANMLVTAEAMLGLLGLGMFAALAFSRLSLPQSLISFSSVAVISPFEGKPTLMFRVANKRNNSIIGADMEVSLFRQETTQEGIKIRRIYDLPLLRRHTPMLSLTWLVLHPIDESSPLFEITEDSLIKSDFALVAIVTGLDETISQTVHSKHTYLNTAIKWNYKFIDMFREDDTGNQYIDLRLINTTEKIN